MGELTGLVNIGAKLEEQLRLVGIKTFGQLKETGSREAWLRIRAMDPSACIMRLSALEGAIQGIRWHNLDAKTKEDLKAFYHSQK
ncbi:MAG: TfoX/Sxy family protein [Christensenellales bacterium]